MQPTRRRRLVYVSALGAIALAVGCLIVLDLLLRFAGPRVSRDLSHTQLIGDRIKILAGQPSPRILFVGNSLTKCGIDPAVFQETFRNLSGVTPSVAVAHPDDTTIVDWYYLIQSRVAMPGLWPDVLVVPFSKAHLTDQATADPGRLGARMGGLQFASEAFRHDVRSLGDRAVYLLSAVSPLFADAERIRNQILAAIVPNYRQTAQVINRSLKGRPNEEDRWTFVRLRRFLAAIPSPPVDVVLVAVPLPQPFAFPAGLAEAAAEGGASLVDLRSIRGIDASSFVDGYHLGPEGARRFSMALAARLAARLSHKSS